MTPRDPVAALVARLETEGYDPRPTGPDSWESRCPAHEGTRRNLSIGRGDDGRALVNCHHAPGCTADAIVAAIGLTTADLFPARDELVARLPLKGPSRSRPGPPAHPTPDAAVASASRRLGPPTGRWDYHDASGELVMVVLRFDPSGERKEFRPVHRSDGGWKVGDPPGPLPLYRLPELDGTRWVILCEGEKAADRARGLGVAATTSAHGAKSAGKSDWTPLAGREVVILPDHDPEGESYVRDVVARLTKLEPRPTVRVVRLPDLWRSDVPIPEKGDIAEWLSMGVPESWSDDDCRAALEEAAGRAPVEGADPGPPAEPATPSEPPVPAWPDPPEEPAFDGLAGAIVRAVEPHSEADPVAVLAQLLVGFGNLIGRTAHFVVEADHHFTNEFIALVGDTARGRKGTSWGHARRLLESVDPEWASARVLSGLSTGEGLIFAVRDPVTKREPIREGKAKRITGYQEIETDAGEPDKRLLCIEAELGGTLRVATRDGNSLSALVRQAWDSGSLRTLTRNSPLRATGAHVSIIGHITRDELASLLTRIDAANGFANRFLWLAVRRSKLLPFGGNLGSMDFAPMVNRLRDTADFGRSAGRMDRDAGANELWAEAYPSLAEGRPGLLGAVTSRAEAHTMRLAMLYALIDRSPVITAGHLRSGLALWRFAERSAAFIFGEDLGDPDADALLSALRASPQGLTRSEIREGVFQRNRSAERIAGILRTLVSVGLAHSKTEATGGRPAERWFSGRPLTPSAR